MKGNFKNWLIKSLLILAVTFGFISFSHVTTYAEAAIAEVDTTATVGGYTIKVPAGAEIPNTTSDTVVKKLSENLTFNSNYGDYPVENGWYVVDKNITLNELLYMEDVNLILCDGCTLNVEVSDNMAISSYNLVIWAETAGSGSLNATGYGCGINSEGTLTFNGGTIIAKQTKNNNSYGIVLTNRSEESILTVNDGKLTAIGFNDGIYAKGSLIINGGDVVATGTGTGMDECCGIYYYGNSFNINGGTLTATGVNYSIDGITPIVDSAQVYLGDVAPGTLYDGDDLTAELKKYKYAKIQCKEETSKQDNTATVEAPSTPAMQSTSINGTKLDSWDAVSNAIKSVKAAELNKVADASDSMLQLNIVGTTDKIVPVAVVKALNQANFKFFHIFVGEGDAVTFDTAADNSNYTGISFAHKDTVTETSRTIDFTSKGAIGLNVLFHTTVPKNNATVNIYRMEDGNKVLIATTVSNANGQLCFAIDKTAEYILEY